MFWVDNERLAVGICKGTSCQIVVYALSGSTQTLLEIPDVTSLGNIIFRSA